MNTRSSNYLPTGDSDRALWFSNFDSKIETYTSVIGFTPDEVTTVHKDYAFFQYTINMVEAYKQTVNNLTSYKNLLKHAVAQQHIGALPVAPALGAPPEAVTEGVFDRVSKLVQRIKASVNYTDNMGQDLGIVASVNVVNVDALQPSLTVKLDAGRPHIKCVRGIADALDLYVDRKDGAGFILLGRLLKLDYIDTANLPAATALAQWDYKAMYVISNDNVGVMSAVESIIVKRQ